MSSKSNLAVTQAIRASMRALAIQLSLLNQQVGSRVDLRPVDINCLDVVMREGPLSPTALARRVGLHAATITGILDRLERGGWVARERSTADKRAVVVRGIGARAGDLARQYRPMNDALDDICASYSAAELAIVDDFLERAAAAGREATEAITPS